MNVRVVRTVRIEQKTVSINGSEVHRETNVSFDGDPSSPVHPDLHSKFDDFFRSVDRGVGSIWSAVDRLFETLKVKKRP